MRLTIHITSYLNDYKSIREAVSYLYIGTNKQKVNSSSLHTFGFDAKRNSYFHPQFLVGMVVEDSMLIVRKSMQKSIIDYHL